MEFYFDNKKPTKKQNRLRDNLKPYNRSPVKSIDTKIKNKFIYKEYIHGLTLLVDKKIFNVKIY